ncbi:MAG: sigma 54-interacting transcriptional regulator [Calditrichaeota bacterium]|nr:sigma 54-interacting transcriptional regulator [Calditrichota bacterium]
MEQNLIEFFKQNSLTQNYSHAELEQFVELFTKEIYPPDSTILKEGERNNSFFFLFSGEAKVLKHDETSNDFFQINQVMTGDLFGEMSVLTDESVSASIVAKTKCTVLILSQQHLLSNEIFTKLLLSCTKSLVSRIRFLSEKRARYIAEKALAEQQRLIFQIEESNQILDQKKAELRDTKKHLSNFYLKQGEINEFIAPGKIIGRSKRMQEIFSLMGEVSQSDSTVLITGESGTGKGLIATSIHQLSQRKHEPFISINCAAINDQLLASELFGHKRGAFTGASEERIGRFQLANNGSIFLDEIGDISPQMQAYLLNILETGTFERLGESSTSEVDVRIISATNSNIEEKIQKKLFRSDLFFRLNVVRIEVPPLRERKEDIPMFIEYFLEFFSNKFDRRIDRIDAETLQLLMDYNWLGNVRELKNTLERSVLLCRDNILLPQSLPPGFLDRANFPDTINSNPERKNSATNTSRSVRKTISNLSVEQVLQKTNWNVSKSARELGISRQYLHRLIHKYDLKK